MTHRLRILFFGETWQGSSARALCRALAEREDTEVLELGEDHFNPRPTWSNVGELDEVLDVQLRRNQIVVFGTPLKRERIYARLQEIGGPVALFAADSEIVDIGAPCATAFRKSWLVHALGHTDASALPLGMNTPQRLQVGAREWYKKHSIANSTIRILKEIGLCQ